MAMPTRPMSLRWYAAPRCAWPRPGRSTRALRKAYGIGICSVEEIGSLPARSQPEQNVRKLPPQPANGNGEPKLRDQLLLLIRQHRLNAALVKQTAAYMIDVGTGGLTPVPGAPLAAATRFDPAVLP
jgi:hypothetical protein